MLTSPITVTIDGVAHSLSRINNDNFSAVYLKKWALNELRLNIRHSYEGKAVAGQVERHNVELVHTVWNVDGIPTTTSSYIVIRVPRGADADPVVDAAVGLMAFATTNAAAIVAWES